MPLLCRYYAVIMPFYAVIMLVYAVFMLVYDRVTILCDQGSTGVGTICLPYCADEDVTHARGIVLLEMEASRSTSTC